MDYPFDIGRKARFNIIFNIFMGFLIEGTKTLHGISQRADP